MKFNIYHPDEKWEDTLKVLEAKRDNKIDTRKINANDCQIYVRGLRWIIEYNGKIIYDEHRSVEYPFFESALHFMNPANRAKWKTVAELATFRQAIREATVQGTDYCDMLRENISRRQYNEFMILAREHDAIHHGSNTF
jgi:hypothetical protein